MKKIAILIFLLCGFAGAQSWTAVSAANITDAAGNKLATGQICFLGTDQNNTPINFGIGGGGQVLKRAVCATVANGMIAAGFQVPNPANTSPKGVLYRIWVTDTNTGQQVLQYTTVSFQGGAFDLDNYQPSSITVPAPPMPSSVTGPLNIDGDVSLTGTLSAAQIGGTPTFSAPINAKNIGQVRYASQYNWSYSLALSLTSGSLSNIELTGPALPSGVTSGGFSRVSISGTTVTWVSGDKFNPNWANKSATINSGSYVIASCSSSTSCTLSTSYAGSTAFGPWMAVGRPTSVYISGGTGTAESMTILGVGAPECPGGTATSICGIPANSHSGTYTVQSATTGVQEAINDLNGAAGRVYMPAGTYTWYSTVYALNAGLDLSGYSKTATFVTDSTTSNAPALIVEGNYNHIHAFRINGSSSTGNLIDYWDTSNSGASGQSTFDNLMLSSSTGTGTSVTGAAMSATCFYTSGTVGNSVLSNLMSSCSQGAQIDSNGGAGADGTIFAGNQFTDMSGDGVVVMNGANTTFTGNRFDFNGGLGLDIKGGSGYSITGNYFEHDKGGSITCNGSCYGLNITGNEMSQYDTDGTAFISITPTPGSQTPSTGVHVSGNYMLLNGHGTTPTVTAYISGGFSHSSVTANTMDLASPAAAATYGVNVFAGGNAGAGIGNTLSGNVSGPNGGPTNIVFDQGSNPAVTIPNATGTAVSYSQSIVFNRGTQVVGGAGREASLLMNTGGPAILAGYGLPSIGGTGFSLGGRIIVGNGSGVAQCFSTYSSGTYNDLGCIFDHGNTFNWGTLAAGAFPLTINANGNIATTGTVALNGGGTIASGQTLTNNGTISGGTVAPATLTIGSGPAMTQAPVMTWSPSSSFGDANNGGQITIPSAYTIVRVESTFGQSVTGCSVFPQIQLYDVTASASIVTVTASSGSDVADSGAISVSVPAAHKLSHRYLAGVGCTPSGIGSASTSVQYQMQ